MLSAKTSHVLTSRPALRGGVLLLLIAGLLALAGCTLAGDPVPAGQIERSDASDLQAAGPTLSPTITLPPSVGYPIETPNPVAGSFTFVERCASCHGLLGDGTASPQFAQNLADAGAVLPDFTDVALSRSRTPAEYFQVITEGRLDNFMPPWGNELTEAERWDLVAFIYTLSTPPESIEAGEAVYTENCAECHGANGAGGSPGAPDLTDGQLATNRSPQAWFDVVAAGAGTMPAFGESLSEDDLWSVVAYTRTFAYGDAPTVSSVPPTPEPAPEGDVSATEDGVLHGVVFNETSGQPAEGVTVSLHGLALTPDGGVSEVITQEIPSGADGTYRFEDLPANEENLVYVVSLIYQNSAFSSDVVVLAGDVPVLELPPLIVYDVTSDASAISIENMHIVLTPEGEDAIVVAQIYIFSNSSDSMYLSEQTVGQGLRRAAVEVASPEQAFGHAFEDGEIGRRFIPSEQGYYDTVAVFPGSSSHSVIMSYLIPLGNNTLKIPLMYNANNVTLIYEPEALRVSASGFQPDDQINDPMLADFEVLSKGGFVAGDELVVTVRTASASGSVLPYVGGFVALGLVVAAAWWWRKRAPAETPKDTKASARKQVVDEKKAQAARTEQERQRLMQAIADLDDAHEAGKVNKNDYEAQRARLMAEVVALSDS